MTPEALSKVRDHELIILRILSGEYRHFDVLLTGMAIFPNGPDQAPCFYISHPAAPTRCWLRLEDDVGFDYHATGMTIEETRSGDQVFNSYYEYAARVLDVQKNESTGYVYCSAALALEQAANLTMLDPKWFDGVSNIPLPYIDDVHELINRTGQYLLDFCVKYLSLTDERVLN